MYFQSSVSDLFDIENTENTENTENSVEYSEAFLKLHKWSLLI